MLPPIGSFTLNVDGSAKDGSIACGGIIRDSNGDMVAAFSTFYGDSTNNIAKFMALKEGLELCRSMNLENIRVECVLHAVVHAYNTVTFSAGDFSMCFEIAFDLFHCLTLSTINIGNLRWSHIVLRPGLSTIRCDMMYSERLTYT